MHSLTLLCGAWLETKSPETESQPVGRPLCTSTQQRPHTAQAPLGTLQPVAASLIIKWVNKSSLRMSSRPVSEIRGFWPWNLGSCPNNWIEKFGDQQWIGRKAKSKCKQSKLISLSSPHPTPSLKALKLLFCNITSKITLAFKVSSAVEKKKTSWDPERGMAQLKGIYICHCVAINKLWPHLLFSVQLLDPEYNLKCSCFHSHWHLLQDMIY